MKNKIKKQQNKRNASSIKNKVSARVALMPEGVAITAINNMKYYPYGDRCPDTLTLFKEIQEQQATIEKGELGFIERYLYAQAIALNALFEKMLVQLQGSKHISQAQLFGTLALKAQAQCRNTLGTLAQIKNPEQITFIKQNIKQQNNALNQQINNFEGIEKIENIANELLNEVKNATLDCGRAEAAININPTMETVAEVYRGKIS